MRKKKDKKTSRLDVERQKLEERKQAARMEQETRRTEEEFADSPAGKARAAREAGAKLFQLDLPLSKTKPIVVPMIGAFTRAKKIREYVSMFDAIEAEGWQLEHAGYVYRLRGSQSRDKFFMSGKQEAMEGEIIGIYIFRVVDDLSFRNESPDFYEDIGSRNGI